MTLLKHFPSWGGTDLFFSFFYFLYFHHSAIIAITAAATPTFHIEQRKKKYFRL